MGGTKCCVPGCRSNNLREKTLSYYILPKSKELRGKWMSNIRDAIKDKPILAEKFSTFVPTKASRVCSLHFEGGKKTYMKNKPTVFPEAGPPPPKKKRKRRKKVEVLQAKLQALEDAKNSPPTVEHSYSLSDEDSIPKWRDYLVPCDTILATGLETDVCIGANVVVDGNNVLVEKKNIEADRKLTSLLEIERKKTIALTSQLEESEAKCARLKVSVNKLLIRIPHKKKSRSYSVYEALSLEAERFKFYTGLSVEDFDELFKFICNDIPRLKYLSTTGEDRSKLVKRQWLMPKDELLLVLFKLTAGLDEQDIAYRFGVNIRSVPIIYRAWADLLYSRFDC